MKRKINLLILCLLFPFLNYSQLVDNGDGTITDTSSDLMWMKNADEQGIGMTWDSAMIWVENLVFAGHNDWRLPSAGMNGDGTVCNSRSSGANCTDSEFWTLYLQATGITPFTPGPFENVTLYYWTSTEWPDDTNNAMTQDMLDGGQNDFPKSDLFRAWAVRDAEPITENLDVWIKDCPEDQGEDVPSVPDPCQVAFKSPDIFIDNDGDLLIDAPDYGHDNILHAVVRNRSNIFAQNVTATFYYRDNTTGLIFPNNATLIGVVNNIEIAPNSYTVVSTTWGNLPENPEETGSGGHWCIGVVLSHPNDLPETPAVGAAYDNNVAIANIWHLAQRAGEDASLGFNVSAGGANGFGFPDWPRKFVLKVENLLPQGWTWNLDGLPVGEEFILKKGEERLVQLKVNVPENAEPHTGGSIGVHQVDVETGRVVGGLQYNLYEDHLPPEKVKQIDVALVDGKPVLTWTKVKTETESGLHDRIGYYEISRNKEYVAIIRKDEDPTRAGMQWTDNNAPNGKNVYTIRVADQGRNISALSDAVEITLENGTTDCDEGSYCNMITWILLIIVIVLIIYIFIIHRRN